MTKQSLLLTALLSAALLTGCWDRREINDVGFALATAIDRDSKGTFQVAVQVAVPTALSQSTRGMSNEGHTPVMTVISQGKEFDHLRADLQTQMSRKLNTSHRRVLVIGESMAKFGLHDVLDEFSRNPQNRLRTYLIVARGRKASELLSIEYPIEAYPSEGIREMEKLGLGTGSTLRDFLIESTMPGMQPIVTTYTLTKQQPHIFKIDGVAVFHDLKLVGYLEGPGVQGALIVKEKLKDSVFTLKIPSGGDHYINVQSKEIKCKPHVEIQNGKPHFSYHVAIQGIVMQNTSKLDLINPKYIEELNAALAKKVCEDVQAAIGQLQKLKSDGVGAGTELYRHHPDEWDKLKDDWPNQFAQQQFTVTADAQVRQVGMLGPQLEIPSSEVIK
ncbi:Ger(x)C family spore germination protein [Tumebacillus permanentifrigoris]|uniref:Spore germination protein KC n=1 Tax=Tumebacillus permanentifrigoris TaxID=378543 RepID=A0A316D854_9BACL|nr:Ger(x)C family spore germination protein [Tumebacillus permanentifrigoris]PWK10241.1 spore germination protein KC [Tumebacillus permanentifrigoris]